MFGFGFEHCSECSEPDRGQSTRTPSTPTPLLTRQEAKRRATLQPEPSLPSLSIIPTTTLDREPHGSNPTESTPLSPHLQPDESELSDTDSSTGSPTLTFLFSKRNITKMDNTDKQPLAEVQTAKMKDCPILTAGKITPLVLQSWALACKRYMKHA